MFLLKDLFEMLTNEMLKGNYKWLMENISNWDQFNLNGMRKCAPAERNSSVWINRCEQLH